MPKKCKYLEFFFINFEKNMKFQEKLKIYRKITYFKKKK